MRIVVSLIIVCVAALTSGCALFSDNHKLTDRVDEIDRRLSVMEKTQTGTAKVEESWQFPQAASSKKTDISGSKAAVNKKVSLSNRDIQSALKNAGYYSGTIDGKLGKMSKKAIREFQFDHSLKVDGIPGQITQQALAEYLAK